MSKFYRTYEFQPEGHVLTEQAFKVLKTQIFGLDGKEIASVEIDPTERIYDVEDLIDLGYSNEPANADELTEQTDDNLFELNDAWEGFEDFDS
jgi:hypothetical protein